MAVLFARVFVLLGQVLSSLGVVSSLAQNTTQEHLKYQVENTVVATSLNVGDPTFGLAAIRTFLTTIDAKLDALALDIADIPTTPQLSTNPVILPTTPPTGYGANTGTIADAVWGYLLGPGTAHAGDLLHDAGWAAVNQGFSNIAFPIRNSKYFKYFGSWPNAAGSDGPGAMPIFPLANILPDDTLSSFLERESYYTGWTANEDTTYSVPSGTGDFKFATTITEPEFVVLRDGSGGGPDISDHLPPVWPGVLNVTFGTPIAISTGFTVSEMCDGVIVSISGVPTRANFFQFDDKPNYRNLGALSFFTDDNEQEQQQPLGFESQIYTPRTMFQAAGVKIRTIGGVSGTVTPWHRTPI